MREAIPDLSRFELQSAEPTIEKILTSSESIKISVEGDDEVAFDCALFADEAASYPKWQQSSPIPMRDFAAGLEALDLALETQVTPEILERIMAQIVERLRDRPAGRIFPDSWCTRPRTPRSALFRPKDRSCRSESGVKVCSLI